MLTYAPPEMRAAAAYARKTVDIAAAGVCLALAGRVFARFVEARRNLV